MSTASLLLYTLPQQAIALPLAAQLQLPAQVVPDFERATLKALRQPVGSVAVLCGEDLALQLFDSPLPGPVRVDWADKSFLWRLQHGGGRGELLAKACGIKGDFVPSVLDATAGFGRDAVLLASLGCQVHMLERAPLVHALLADGLRRAAAEPALQALLPRLSLQAADAAHALAAWTAPAPDVICLDPMFPAREKSARVKVNMQAFHQVVGADHDADALLALARALARKRVVVKRPKLAPPLAGQAADLVFAGESSRFDVYLAVTAAQR